MKKRTNFMNENIDISKHVLTGKKKQMMMTGNHGCRISGKFSIPAKQCNNTPNTHLHSRHKHLHIEANVSVTNTQKKRNSGDRTLFEQVSLEFSIFLNATEQKCRPMCAN